MKNEKQLLTWPIHTAPDIETTEYSEVQKHGNIYQVKNYLYIATLETILNSRILCVTVYSYDKKPLWRVWQTDKNHALQYLSPTKVSYQKDSKADKLYSSSLYTICGWGFYYTSDEAYFTNIESEETIYKFCKLSREENALRTLGKYQQNYLKERLNAQHEKIRESLSDSMLQIKPLPKDFETWVLDYPLINSRYFFYEYTGKKLQRGWCSHCGQYSLVKGPKNRTQGTCPVCKSKVIYIAQGKFNQTYGFTDKANVAYYQKTKDGFVIREFKATIYYQHRSINNNVPVNKDVIINENARIFYDNGQRTSQYSKEGGTYAVTVDGWHREHYSYSIGRCHIYYKNVKKIFEPFFPYMPLQELAKYGGYIDTEHFVSVPKEKPMLEYLIKLKLFNLAAELVNGDIGNNRDLGLNINGKNLKQILGIGKEHLPLLQQLNVTNKILCNCHYLLRLGIPLVREQIEIIKQMELDRYDMQRLELILSNISLMKALRYLKEQTEGIKVQRNSWEHIRPKRYSETLSDWYDYLKTAKFLQSDMHNQQVFMPKDLMPAHDAVMEAKKTLKDEFIAAGFEAIVKRFLGWSWEHKNLIIRPATSKDELKEESAALHHCVGNGTYYKNMAEGEIVIMFIRKKTEPDEPYYTLEYDLEYGCVKQCRGLRNCGLTKEVEQFIEGWEAKIVNAPVQKKKCAKEDAIA